ncbi:MAG: methyltransferase [Candidatus Pacearchaeota archaeon]|nr:methyltransferase [Candidatus Pacearchaeota archaeon]
MSIYSPAEDSYLMSKILENNLPELIKQNPDLKFLEIGTGNGIHLQTALDLRIKKENIFSSDINQEAVSHCKSLGFNCIHSDLFENFKKEMKFSLIIFNPPYLPEDSKEPRDSRIATTGGKKGSETINKFLEQAKNYLDKNGKIFLLTSSFTKGINFKGYKKRLLEKKKLFFEEICVWELKPTPITPPTCP